MQLYQTILWDLDGTLTDPGEGITNSVMYALKRFGITAQDRQSLYCFIGPPLADSFVQFYGFTPQQAADAVAYYREYYAEQGIFENRLYPGIPQVLQQLQQRGCRHVLATSKPQMFAERILAHFGLEGYFSHVVGSDMAGKRAEKTGIITTALQQAACPKDTAVMVGDRSFDMAGAKQNGIVALGVLYGYGTRQELLQAGADALADTPQAAANWILQACAPN